MKSVLKVVGGFCMLAIWLTACGGGGGGGSDNGGSGTIPTYTVTYDGNGAAGGSVPTDATNYAQNQVVTVPGNPGNLVKDHFTFAGWNTASDGSGTNYAQGQTFTMGTANVTLYAKWTAKPTYTVTYDGNGSTGGNVPVDSTNYEETQTVTVIGNTGNLVRTHFAFASWNTASDGSGTTYTQGATFPMGTSNVILYAQWTANPTYRVTYDANGATGGTPPVDTINYEQGNIVTVLGNTGNLVRTNFTFAGWNTAADGSGTNYAQGQTFTMGTANVTLYARWTANPTYTVTYDGNGSTGGSVPVDSSGYEQGQTVTVLGNTGNLVRTNFTFAGWNTAADGSGTNYAQGQTFTMGSANVILYARWTANTTYTVTYNGNGSTGGSVPTDAANYGEGATVTVLGNTGNLVFNNYIFVCWNTQADGNGTDYVQGQTFAMGTANVTLYAKWRAVSPLSPDANTILLDHFDGSTTASILGVVETGVCGVTAKPAAAPTSSYEPGPSGLSQALSLGPPAGQPAGSASYLRYSGELLSQVSGTLEFWVFLTSYGTGLFLVEQGPYYSTCTGWTFEMSVSSTGQLMAYAEPAFSVYSGAATVPLNTWTHLAVTWGSTSVRLYINGVQVGLQPFGGSPASGFAGNVHLRLGTHDGITTWIDELRISNIERTW